MPRGGPPTYTYSLPAIYLAVPGTLITAAQHNTPLEDIASTFNAAWPVNLGGTGGTTAAALLAAENRFTATQSWDKGADIASATALILGIDGNYFHVTGTTTITSISTEDSGTWIALEFDAALTLTHNGTSLILPGAANITTAAGDTALFVSEGSGNWRCLSYQRASAAPYQTGTFTPTYMAGGVSTGVTYSLQVGSYTRIGRLVFFTLRVTLSNAGSATGNVSVGGLPFAVAARDFAATVGFYTASTGLTGTPLAFIATGASAIEIRQSGATGLTAVTQANITNNFSIIISGSYEVS